MIGAGFKLLKIAKGVSLLSGSCVIVSYCLQICPIVCNCLLLFAIVFYCLQISPIVCKSSIVCKSLLLFLIISYCL